MKLRAKLFALMCGLLAIGAGLMPGLALAQTADDQRLGMALAGGFMMILLVFCLIGYVYMSLALMTIAQKTNTENGWMAWIPIVNIVLMCNIAQKPVWWILLCLIPLVNIVIFIILWMGIAEARNKPNWWGILMLVPVVSLIVPGYLAWSD